MLRDTLRVRVTCSRQRQGARPRWAGEQEGTQAAGGKSGWSSRKQRGRLRCGGSSGGAPHHQVAPIPLLDLGFNLKVFSAGGCPVHLAGSEGANLIAPDLRGTRLLVLLHPASRPSLGSHQAKYLDTRNALSNRRILSPFPLACARFLQGCLTPASLESGPVPSAAGTPGARPCVCTEPGAPLADNVHRQPGGWGVPELLGGSEKSRGGPPNTPTDCISSGHH